MKTLLLIFFALSTQVVQAEKISASCKEIQLCAKRVAQLTGQKYTFDKDVKGTAEFTDNIELTKENAELYFTQILDMNGYARVLQGDANSYVIMKVRDARDSVLQTYSATYDQAPKLPHTWDLVTLTYYPKSKDIGIVDELARMMRSFSPPNSRVIPNEIAKTLVITDSAQNLKKAYEIMKIIDQDLTSEALEARKSVSARYEKLAACPACQCPSSH